jgi:WD40 repeat protein
MQDEENRVVLFVVAQTTYANWQPLTDLEVDVLALKNALAANGSGYSFDSTSLLNGGSRADTELALTTLADSLTTRDRLVLYWTGHGAGQTDHYLITQDSPQQNLTSFKAIRAGALGEVLAKSKAEKIVLFVDTCYSSHGAQAIAEQIGKILNTRTYAPGQRQFFAVFPSAHSTQRALAGVLCRTLLDVLTGTDPALRTWTDRDRFITVGALRDALLDAMQQTMGDGWQPPVPVIGGWGDRFLPNPRYHPGPPLNVEDSRERVKVPQPLHVAALGIDAGEAGRYFTPRRVMDDVAGWLTGDGPGLTVVTGAPGAGKSAVLGHIALRSTWNTSTTSLTAVVHARGKTVSQVTSEIQVASSERPVVVIDAIDEAADPRAVAALAASLVRDRGARVLVGSRKSLDGRPLLDSDPLALLRGAFGADATIIDLDDDRDTDDDIAAYVRRRLEDSRHRTNPDLVEDTAKRVAKAAAGSFLYARVVSRTLQHAERLDGPLPDDQLDAFDKDLRERFPQQLPLIETVLAGLAWSRGNGVSREAWSAMANAVGPSLEPITDRDIAWTLDHVGWHILETEEAEQTVYRLIHQAFADYFRERTEDTLALERRIARELAAGFDGNSWLNADPYRRRHLAEHAAAGGVLDTLVMQVAFLAVAEPTFLLAVLHLVRRHEARRVVHVYRRFLVLARGMPDNDRPAILHLAAQQQDSSLAERFRMTLAHAWQCRWAHWRALVPSTTIASLEGGVDAGTVASGPKGEPILVYATGSHVFALDPTSPSVALWRVNLALDNVEVLASHRLDNDVIVAVGDTSGGLHLIRASDRSVIRVQAHTARVQGIAFVADRQTVLVATCSDDRDIALWTISDGRAVSRATGVMQPTAIATIHDQGKPAVLVTGDSYQDERLPPAGTWSVPALSRVRTYDVATLIDIGLVVELGQHRVVLGSRLGELVAWNLTNGAPIAVTDFSDGNVKADSFMPLHNDGTRAIVATCYGTGQFHTLDVTVSGSQLSISASPWIETGGGLWLGPIVLWGQRFLVSAGRELRIWQVSDLLSALEAAPRQTHVIRRLQSSYGVLSIAASKDEIWFGVDSGELLAADRRSGSIQRRLAPAGGRPVALWSGTIFRQPCLLVGSYEGFIHCLDSGTGRPRRPAIAVGGPVTSLAVTRGPVASHLAVTTRSAIDGRDEYHVRLWALPEFDEIDTRHADRDAQLIAFGARPHWQLAVANYEREKPLNAVTFLAAREGPLVAAGGDPMTVMVWDVASLDWVVRCTPPSREGRTIPDIVSLTELVDGRDLMLVGGTEDGTVVAWELTKGRELWSHREHTGQTHVAAVWWRGNLALASGGQDGVLRIWTPAGVQSQHIRIGGAIWSLGALPDGGIAVGTNLGLVVIDDDRRH